MTRLNLVSFSLLLGSIMLPAQIPNQSKTPATVIFLPIASSPCPVGLHAKQNSGGDILAISGAHPKGVGQSIRLILTNPDSRRIVGASVTVRGLTGKSRVIETLSSPAVSDAAKSIDVTFTGSHGNEISADLWVPGMSSVQAIDLSSVTYSDGSTWKLVTGNLCHAVPDPIMLIGAR